MYGLYNILYVYVSTSTCLVTECTILMGSIFIHIWEVLGLNFSPEIGSPEWFLVVSHDKYWDKPSDYSMTLLYISTLLLTSYCTFDAI
jgi:hypothetical protein